MQKPITTTISLENVVAIHKDDIEGPLQVVAEKTHSAGMVRTLQRYSLIGVVAHHRWALLTTLSTANITKPPLSLMQHVHWINP